MRTVLQAGASAAKAELAARRAERAQAARIKRFMVDLWKRVRHTELQEAALDPGL
jgi:hypothetical protein